jgi:L-aminopeptidase/D-esterase-like protein
MSYNSNTAFCGVRAVYLIAAISMLIVAGGTFGQSHLNPVPKVRKDGPNLQFDFPGLKIGIAEYEEGPTGTTVFFFPDGVKAAVDVRGGSPGTLNAAGLKNSYDFKTIEAVVFSGGSSYGLSAATGVANGIKELKEAEGDFDFTPGVVGGIIYDVGGRRYSRITPDDPLGLAALMSAQPGHFPLGAQGAGRFAMQGVYYLRGDGADMYAGWPHSGQGGAFRLIGPTRIAVFTVVNSLGTIVDRSGQIVRCKRNSSDEACPSINKQLKAFAPIGNSAEQKRGGLTSNTTLTLVVTNQKLPFAALQRLAVQVHGSMNRAIQPFSTEHDGDVLYAVTTDEIDNPSLSPMDLGVLASELAWDAVLSSIPEVQAVPRLRNEQPNADELQRLSGTYEFHGGNDLEISVEAGSLTATSKQNGRIYFDKGRKYQLSAAEGGLFIIESAARDVIRFDESDGRIVGLTLNPGDWSIHAKLRR